MCVMIAINKYYRRCVMIDCPECGKEMTEEFGCISDSDNDEMYDVMIGYECKACGFKMDTNGEVVD